MTDKPNQDGALTEETTEVGGPMTEEQLYPLAEGWHQCASGKWVKINPFSPLLTQRITEAFNKRNPMPDPPKYEVELAGGELEHHFHDETTIHDGTATPAELAQWKAYQATKREMDVKLQAHLTRAVVLRGLEFDLPEDDDWKEAQLVLDPDLEIPEDGNDLRVYYFETEIVGDMTDIIVILSEAMGTAAMMDEEPAAVAGRLFRANL